MSEIESGFQMDVEKYQADSSYFENRSCQYYPCHEGMEHINCLFCYCPMYPYEKCLGKPEFITRGDKTIKSCMDCRVPHIKDNYPKIMEFLKNHM